MSKCTFYGRPVAHPDSWYDFGPISTSGFAYWCNLLSSALKRSLQVNVWLQSMCFTRRRVTAILCLQPRDCPWSPGLPTRHDSSNQTFVNESEVITFPPTISGQKTFGTGLTRLLNPLHTHRERSNNYCQWFCPLTPLTPSLPKTSQNLKIVREKFSQLITLYLFHFWWHKIWGKLLI